MVHASQPLTNALLQWQDDGLPRSATYGDIYFSGAGLAETSHVFLDGNDLEARWRGLDARRFTLGECGFGSGLNFLCAWRLWDAVAPAGRSLHFISCEKHPFLLRDLARVQAQWPELASRAAALQAVYPEHSAGLHRLHLGSAERPVVLDLLYGEAAASLADLLEHSPACVDAWFLDGFAPDRNPDMWSPELFGLLAGLSGAGASLATYTVAAQVRRGLAEAGFTLEKAPGHGRKRHMLKARLGASGTAARAISPVAPWFSLPPPRRAAQAVVIGGGMAGCATAWALARKGIPVTLLEREERVAAGASGNPRGALYLKLGRRLTPALAFQLQAYLHALRHYPALQTQSGVDLRWQPCGLLQLAWNAEEIALMEATARDAGYAPQVLRQVTAAQASELAGVALDSPGLWLPGGAALDPPALCEAYRRHPGIETRLCSEALALERDRGRWRIVGENGILVEAEALVIAGGLDSLRFPPCAGYPLSPVRGQLSGFCATDASSALRAILCMRGYVMPALDGRHWVGASFVPGSSATDVSELEHRYNLEMASTVSASLHEAFSRDGPVAGRAALRCVSKDHVPVVGPVENRAEILALYGELRRNARRRFTAVAEPEPGLYINTAHGSHGLTSTPLAAEYLASLIAGEPPPLQGEAIRALHPARFLIRQLKRREV